MDDPRAAGTAARSARHERNCRASCRRCGPCPGASACSSCQIGLRPRRRAPRRSSAAMRATRLRASRRRRAARRAGRAPERSPAPWAWECAPRICSASVVPERGMPTMNTGAGSALPARGPLRVAFRREGRDRRVDIGPCRFARERLDRLQQRVARCAQCAKALASSPCARPELGEVVMRHDPVFEHGARPHGSERGLHRLRRRVRRRRDDAHRRARAAVAPKPRRHEFRRRGAERIEFAERGARLVRPAERDQRQRPLQMPVARGGDIVGRADRPRSATPAPRPPAPPASASATRLSRAPASCGLRASASRSSVSAAS